jgi:hypothetical protein
MAVKSKNKNGSNGKSKTVARKSKHSKLHDKLIQLFSRPDGATMHDTYNAGWPYSAKSAVKIAERRGLKITTKKELGELKRYIARPAAAR